MGEYLEVAKVGSADGEARFKVVKQRYRGTAFYPSVINTPGGGESAFLSSTDFCLCSSSFPEYVHNPLLIVRMLHGRYPTLFVRGETVFNDDVEFTVPFHLVDRMLVAVNEYNAAMYLCSPPAMLEF